MEYIEYIKYINEMVNRVVKFPPGAEALVPINPMRIPSYVSGIMLSDNLEKGMGIVTKPVHNLEVAKNFITTAHNTSHAFKRGAEVAVDTVKINLMAESVPLAGPALAGQHASDCAKKYTEQMVTDYKLVDSVKQKALKSKWLKTYGDNFVQSVTTHRAAPQVPNIPKNTNLTVDVPVNFSAAGNHTRSPLWSLKYRGVMLKQFLLYRALKF